ncbi:MAG: FAD-dependent oxidoreductase, partial [Gammaproteobacteria bacterium]|nr:FAD-dependent oxidoreductase [Gammaproteobacteria bacterium]
MTADEILVAMPSRLVERCRILKAVTPAPGEFVLYWMHHSVRGHENPVLDVAIELANHLGLPALVYQGLGGGHPFDNDRHHTFILEGARDAHRELELRGIRTLFHLASDPSLRSPLHDLVGRAAVTVVEDYPAPPFPRWTAKLASRSIGPVVAVDGSCLIPMQSQPCRFERAFEFRRHNQADYARRVMQQWSEALVQLPCCDVELGFDPLDLHSADIAELCAACAIDHSVPPVAHTRGGSTAGYARWQRFRREGLPGYATKRNDAAQPWPQGVSRLSAYLHHGHVSPFRIAREAAETGGVGADKFLDELLIWRELAFNFCFHEADPECLRCLPEWAQKTLADHAGDTRPQVIDEEALSRSRSGDALWDLAQDSLRMHGELHNNVRMTWAKAIPAWRATPQQALDTLVELNHRFALDGSDPNSYGGLLWTLGLFDRPFPERPVTGRLRERSSKRHAARLDMARYRAGIARPSSGQPLQIAVIGAGIAGLAAARTLQDQGHSVTVFEKSRGPGGRASTRRYGEVGYDHGAQYFTARDTTFQRAVTAWQEAGVVDRWPARMGLVEDGQILTSPDGRNRFVAVPGMNALGKHLARDLTVCRQARVAPPRFESGGWQLHDEAATELGVFDALIVAVPAPQAVELLRPQAPAFADTAAAVRYDPMWALMVEIADGDPIGFDGLFVRDSPFRWIARNHAKPGRQGRSWIAHADADWTRANLDIPGDQAAALLTEALIEMLGVPTQSVMALGAHRWLYSLVAEPLDVGTLYEHERHLAVCGDWCRG